MHTRRTVLAQIFAATVLAGSPLLANPAEAKKKKKKKKSSGLSNSIQLTGVNTLDKIFKEARDIDGRLDDTRTVIRSGRVDFATALGLKEGTPFADAVEELRSRSKGKVKAAAKGNGLALTLADGLPSNVQSAANALKNTVNSYTSAVTNLGKVSKDISQLVSATKKVKKTVQNDPTSLGISVLEAPAILRTSLDNFEMMANMPNRIAKLTTDLTKNLNAVRKAFT